MENITREKLTLISGLIINYIKYHSTEILKI